MVEYEKVKVNEKRKLNLKKICLRTHILGGSSIHRADAVRMYSLLSSYKNRFLFVKKARKKHY